MSNPSWVWKKIDVLKINNDDDDDDEGWPIGSKGCPNKDMHLSSLHYIFCDTVLLNQIFIIISIIILNNTEYLFWIFW